MTYRINILWNAVLVCLLISWTLSAQEEVQVNSFDGLTLYGTLLQPKQKSDHAVLLISGSGPTDRDGNTKSAGAISDCLKKLAESLTAEGYPTLRYDKRRVGKSLDANSPIEDLRFEHHIKDAESWMRYLKARYSKVTVIGHSLGAIVAMTAAQGESIDQLISLAGLSEDVNTTLRRQLSSQPSFVLEAAAPIMDSLQAGHVVREVPPYLNVLFGPKVQGYFASFMVYDPRKEIQRLTIPVLVIQGDQDLQITVEGAKQMAAQNSSARFAEVSGMNHVLRDLSADPSLNLQTYADPSLPLHPELIPLITTFIQQ
jgi:pimeloyl-ACP methyl ester carboxylesterase